jgi:outer membrane protein insertion porin family
MAIGNIEKPLIRIPSSPCLRGEFFARRIDYGSGARLEPQPSKNTIHENTRNDTEHFGLVRVTSLIVIHSKVCSRSKKHRTGSAGAGKLSVALSLVMTLILGTAALAQQRQMKLAKIQVEGLERLTSDEVVATSGLKVDETYDVGGLDAAAKLLVDSGLFKSVAYKTQTVSGLTTIIFRVEELKTGASPVAFDNFVWFRDEELAEAIRRDVPSFAGAASDSGNMTDRITATLQRLLKERNLPGTVEYMPSQDLASGRTEHLFSVVGVKIPICTVDFSGSSGVSEAALIKNSKELIGTKFSRTGVGAYAVARLYPLYREVGLLRARFGQAHARLVGSSNCKDGVDLTVPVEEGAVYSWEKAVWTGNQSMSVAALEAELGMKNGEVANGAKYDEGLRKVRRAYGRKGHLFATLQDRLEFDDAARRVSYKIDVREGPQFRMGNLVVKGFSEGEERFLRESWRLTPGDVYDAGYLEEFLKSSFGTVMTSVSQRLRAESRDPSKVVTDARPDRRTLKVDVVFEIVN